MTTSIEDKTIRPNSLMGYAYYHPGHQTDAASPPEVKVSRHKATKLLGLLMVVLVLAVIIGGINGLNSAAKPAKSAQSSNQITNPTHQTIPATIASSANACQNNTLHQLVLVSISRRHLWACQASAALYNTPVITGMSMYPDTITPTGTYYIFAKETHVTLTGSDSAGSWSDQVSYWMPFLNNQYGTYGLHDATWRTSSDFGNISPDSSQASNGCVELPLAAAKWLYNWTVIGTTVTIAN